MVASGDVSDQRPPTSRRLLDWYSTPSHALPLGLFAREELATGARSGRDRPTCTTATWPSLACRTPWGWCFTPTQTDSHPSVSATKQASTSRRGHFWTIRDDRPSGAKLYEARAILN